MNLFRKNKDKINLKRLCFDLTTSIYTIKNDGVGTEDSNKALTALVELKNRFKTESSIMTKDLAKSELSKKRDIEVKSLKHKGICTIYSDWK